MADEKPPEGTPASTNPDPAAEKAEYEAGLKKLLAGEPDADQVVEGEGDGEKKPDADDPEKKPEDEGDGEDDEEKPDGEDDDEDPKVAEEALRRLQKEKRTFEKHRIEVLALEQTVKAREEKVGKAEQELASLLGEMSSNPVEALLRHKFITDADLSFWGRQFFLLSPEGLKDPRSRAEAERLRQERARDIESRRALSRVEKLEQERAAEKAEAAAERELNQYVTQLDASLPTYKEKTPLLSKAMEKDASATKRELYSVAAELAQANGGRFVEPGRVFVAWEKRQREFLARVGLDAPAKPAAAPNKEKTKTAAKSQGQGKSKSAAAAEETAEERVPEAGSPEYFAELRKRLNPQ